MSKTILLRLPVEFKSDFALHWKQLRIADGLTPDMDLPDPVTIDRFDGAALVEWAMTLTNAIAPIVTAVLGYLASQRGEVECRVGDRTMKFRNVKPSQIEGIIKELNAGIKPDASSNTIKKRQALTPDTKKKRPVQKSGEKKK